MGFEKGHTRPANSGRKKGTPNKRKVLRVEEYLAQKNINPVEKILSIIETGELKKSEEISAWFDLLNYVQPKLKPIEVTTVHDGGELDGESLLEKFSNVSDENVFQIIKSVKGAP